MDLSRFARSEPYGRYLAEQTVSLQNGTNVSAWAAHYDCMRHLLAHDPTSSAEETLCQCTTFPQALYQDDCTADRAVELLRRAPKDTPWFLWGASRHESPRRTAPVQS